MNTITSSPMTAPIVTTNPNPTRGGSNLFDAHNQWHHRPADQRYETLDALTESVKARRMRARSQDAELTQVHITAEGTEIHVNGQTTTATPTNWAFGQLATVLGAPAGYLRSLPAPLAAENLRHGLTVTEKQTVKMMSLANDGDDARTLQAVTSPTYGRIWDADVADAANRIVERTNGRFYNPKAYVHDGSGLSGITGEIRGSGLYASDRDIFIFMIDGGSLLDVSPRAQLNRGFFLWNSEVGAKTFGVTTFLFNVVCGNHIVWGASDVNTTTIRHTKNGPYRFDSEAAPALLEYANASAKPLEDAIRRAIEYRMRAHVPSAADSNKPLTFEQVQEFIGAKVTRAKFTKGEIREAMDAANREEGQCETLWDLSQGMTAYARGFDFLDARTDLETRAGRLLELVK